MNYSTGRRNFFKLLSLGAGATLAPPLKAGDGETVSKTVTSPSLVLETDVLVVGAGPSGIPAAIAAARSGAKVILAEQDFVPGGAPVNMYVSMICGGPQVGLARELHERLNAQFDLNDVARIPRTDEHARNVLLPTANWWYLPSSFMNVYLGMIGAEKNILFKPGLRASGVLFTKGKGGRTRIGGVQFDAPGSVTQVVKARVVIDATGTGLIAHLAGCDCRYGRDTKEEFGEPWGTSQADENVQRLTWMYISQRIRPGASLDVKQLQGTGLIENAIANWVGHGPADYYERNTGIYLHWGATVECRDTRNPSEIADAQMRAFPVIKHDMEVMARSGFAMHLAPKIGVREVRRVMGEYVLTINDLYNGAQPEDTVALSHYGLDAWGTPVPPEYQNKAVKPYGIPYRSLIPRHMEGLIMAGKAISATHMAMSSLRVQPVVASIGTAAGIAASLAAHNNTGVRDISIFKLRQQLVTLGTLFKTS